MQTQTHSNTPNQSATLFLQTQNVSRHTMSSIELRELINAERENAGEPKVRNDQFIARVEDEIGDELGGCKKIAHPQTHVLMDSYDLTLDQCTLVGMRESKAVRRTVLQKLKAMEAPRELSTLDILQIAMESEKARLLLTIQVEAQAVKIHSLENLFKEGMTHTQFCKGLNGVNVMQVGNTLEGRNWLFNESKSGLRWRVASYARDKYMTEHQVEITPHGKDPFVSFTPVLLKKGAAKLYDLYLSGELPMKKTWDGLFTHDKALKEAV